MDPNTRKLLDYLAPLSDEEFIEWYKKSKNI
jgi:hypothetical protein